MSQMTPENIERILSAVRLGVWPDRACDLHGISKAAMRQWKREHPEFLTELKKAEAAAESAIHSKILRHMDKQWTAAAWMLERRWPQRYGKHEPQPVVVTAKITQDGPPIPEDTKTLADYATAFAAAVAQINARDNPS